MSFRDARQKLLERTELQGDAFCRALSDAADAWLAGLLEAADGGDHQDLALLAVGGYGRGELFPFSDLDVVLVHRGRRQVGTLADALWYPVWDEGVRLDHAVRRPAQVLAVAAEDLRAQLGLLDGRLVAGDATVVVPLLADALSRWHERARIKLPVLAEQVAARRVEHGDVAFLLEPEIKESHGGFRDLHAVLAAARGVPALAEHVDLGPLEAPRRVLTRVRVELHRLTGRASDRLLLQEQDAVAAALDYADADALMAAVAEAGRTIGWVSDDVWRRRDLWAARSRSRVLGRIRRGGAPGAQPERGPTEAEPGVAIWADENGPTEVVLAPRAPSDSDVTLPLRLAAVAAGRGLPVGQGALRRLERDTPAPDDPWPTDLRLALVRLLGNGHRALPALEAIDQYHLLVRMLPEWAAVRNRPQRNAYHRFTVDRHLLETAANAADLAASVSRPDLLLVGALLHDIGKGFPGDHTEAGVKVVASLGRRMGFPPSDVESLVALVRHHLLLADVSTRRDLDDPVTIDTVAEAVGDLATLQLLAALTKADSLATGPAAWGPWKAGLVADLVRRVSARLSGAHDVEPPSPVISDRHRQLMAQSARLGRTVVMAEAPTVTVVARDRPGLLAAVTGVLALRGLDVRSADASGENEFAVEVFTVEPARGRWPDWERVGDEIDAVLRGTLALDAQLAEQDQLYGRRRPRSARPIEISVTFDNTASATSTVVEVHAGDRVGLLHSITQALFSEGLDVTAARASTLGDEVIDAFYVRDRHTGGKVQASDRLERIEVAVRHSLGTPSLGAPDDGSDDGSNDAETG